MSILSPIYLTVFFVRGNQLKVYHISLLIGIISFFIMLGYERTNLTGDITRYYEMYQYACVAEDYFSSYAIAYLGWYGSLRIGCGIGLGFTTISASLIFMAYFSLI